MFYCLSHALRMMYWNIHAKFHYNPFSNTRWYAVDTHTHSHRRVILIVSRNARLIRILESLRRHISIIRFPWSFQPCFWQIAPHPSPPPPFRQNLDPPFRQNLDPPLQVNQLFFTFPYCIYGGTIYSPCKVLVMAQIVVFVFSVTLTFDLCSIVCHTHCAWCSGISMRSFIRIRSVILGDMPWTHTHTQPPKVILIVSRNARLIRILESLRRHISIIRFPWSFQPCFWQIAPPPPFRQNLDPPLQVNQLFFTFPYCIYGGTIYSPCKVLLCHTIFLCNFVSPY